MKNEWQCDRVNISEAHLEKLFNDETDECEQLLRNNKDRSYRMAAIKVDKMHSFDK